jgi:phospholipase/carboxylesterase
MTTAPFGDLVSVSRGSSSADAPLVVLLHGRGADEADLIGLADVLPVGPAYVAVRAPLRLDMGGFTWFENHGIGRPIGESLQQSMTWFNTWLDGIAPSPRPVMLIGFSAGALFSGALALSAPERFAGVALLSGPLPLTAGLPSDRGRLEGRPIFFSYGYADPVIPRELLETTEAYLRDESGADLTLTHDDGGHSISSGALSALFEWVTERIG